MQSAVSKIRQYHDQKQSALIGVPTRRTKTICAPSACQQTKRIQPNKLHRTTPSDPQYYHKSYNSHPSHPQSTCRIESGLPPSTWEQLTSIITTPGALDYKSATRKQACALCFQRPSPPLCVIGARAAARKAPMTLPLRQRLASSPVPRKRREEPWPPQRFFANSGYAKSAHSLRLQKIIPPAHRQAAS